MGSIRFYRNLIDKVFPVTNCFKGRYFEDGVKMLLSKYTRKEISEIRLYAYQDISIFQNIGQAFKDEVMAGKPTKEQMKGYLDTALFELSQIGYGWKEHRCVGVIGSDKSVKDSVHKDLIEDVRDIACCVDIQTLRLLDSVEEIAEYIGYEFPKWWFREDEDCGNNEDLTEYQKECFAKLIDAGYMHKKGDGYRYVWHKSKALLAYTMERIFCSSLKDDFPETKLNKMFGEKRLGKTRSDIHLVNKKLPKGFDDIDRILG